MRHYLLTITLLTTACDYTAVRTAVADLDHCRKALAQDAGAVRAELEEAKRELERLRKNGDN